ncbi:MAG: carboxypeptidase-like regulatory domain-containing protein, partial [Candidatus Cloacimonetes bacterium]|nr:carboxypeptidase-like regulatory domain-containing protein [Candidatus Cloacimonadota bacterium]
MRDLKMNLASLKLTSLLLCLVVGTLLIFVTGCKSSTEPEKTATLIGKIKLESETKLKSQSLTDNSGVTVALYRTAVLDTTIARINTIHPNIGVIINQETEFDHRNQAPLFTTTTNIAGEFSIASIPAGAYNAAILKNGWSVKYLYNVSLTAGLTSDVGELLVKPSISLSGYIANDYTFQADRTYLINTTTSFASPVVIETGARIYVAANESVKFYSMLTAFSSNSVEKFWKFDSSQNLYQTTGAPVDSTSYISEIDVYQGCLLNSGLIRNIRYGVNVSGGNCTISSFELRDFGSGFYFDQNVNAQLSNLSIRNGGSKGIHAMGYADSLRVEKSIFSNNYEG